MLLSGAYSKECAHCCGYQGKDYWSNYHIIQYPTQDYGYNHCSVRLFNPFIYTKQDGVREVALAL